MKQGEVSLIFHTVSGVLGEVTPTPNKGHALMGIITLLTPPDTKPDEVRRLEEGYLAGLPYFMPWLGSPIATDQHLVLKYPHEESASLFLPWQVEPFGEIMIGTPTLMDRDEPYFLGLELARGKLHQVRTQVWDWETAGVRLNDEARGVLRQAEIGFRKGILAEEADERHRASRESLELSCEVADRLVRQYIQQVFEVSRERDGALDTLSSCRLPLRVPTPEETEQIKAAFTSVTLPISWHLVEVDETHYDWEVVDQLVDWAEANELTITAGPLIDFSPEVKPSWWQTWISDPLSIATFMSRFVEAAVRRYFRRISRWHVTASSNCSRAFPMDEDVLLGTTQRLVELARQFGSELDIIVGVSQPWGEYMSKIARRLSPFDFLDELTRCRAGLTASSLEIVMGVDGHGSFCRDLLEMSRLMDLYAWLGMPLYVSLGYPSSDQPDSLADSGLVPGRGSWGDGYTPTSQASWAELFTSLALCKPYVKEVSWVHLRDDVPHVFPNAGLIDAQGQTKPALETLTRLRQEHLPKSGVEA